MQNMFRLASKSHITHIVNPYDIMTEGYHINIPNCSNNSIAGFNLIYPVLISKTLKIIRCYSCSWLNIIIKLLLWLYNNTLLLSFFLNLWFLFRRIKIYLPGALMRNLWGDQWTSVFTGEDRILFNHGVLTPHNNGVIVNLFTVLVLDKRLRSGLLDLSSWKLLLGCHSSLDSTFFSSTTFKRRLGVLDKWGWSLGRTLYIRWGGVYHLYDWVIVL